MKKAKQGLAAQSLKSSWLLEKENPGQGRPHQETVVVANKGGEDSGKRMIGNRRYSSTSQEIT
jgi:hypothetical protein